MFKPFSTLHWGSELRDHSCGGTLLKSTPPRNKSRLLVASKSRLLVASNSRLPIPDTSHELSQRNRNKAEELKKNLRSLYSVASLAHHRPQEVDPRRGQLKVPSKGIAEILTTSTIWIDDPLVPRGERVPDWGQMSPIGAKFLLPRTASATLKCSSVDSNLLNTSCLSMFRLSRPVCREVGVGWFTYIHDSMQP